MTIIVSYAGRVAARVGRRTRLAAHIATLEPDHPLRVFIGGMALYARAVDDGLEPGPYDDERAEQVVREGLMPVAWFGLMQHRPDAELAEFFAVPLDQIAKRRRDLELLDRLLDDIDTED